MAQIFISYARLDGTDFANKLRDRLEEEGLSVWQDRVGMEGGHDWWLQIVEAIDNAEFMVLVMTPAAMKSPIVRKEWRYARQSGVCVYPAKAAADLNFDSLPRWMRDAHFYDIGLDTVRFEQGAEWRKFLNDLHRRCDALRVPFMCEDLPADFVPRPHEFNMLIDKLLNETREEAVAITAALSGAGGFGKTTLARAICHDEQIQQIFDDGILWVTLGEKDVNLLDKIESLIFALVGQRSNAPTLEAAIVRLTELLADRDLLIVVDDVWKKEHLTPFLQGGKRCARLVTTRISNILPTGAQKVTVDAMTLEEAVALLSHDIIVDDKINQRKLLHLLSERLGRWATLLKLVNRVLCYRIERKSPLIEAVEYIHESLNKYGLIAFDLDNPDERHLAVAATMEVSLSLLSQEERQRFSELATFPEDTSVPLAVLQKLWGTDTLQTDRLCERFDRLSLLLAYDLEKTTIQLHDVVRAYLLRHHSNLPALHSHLLRAYNPTGLEWASIPDDGYLHRALTFHLREAGLYDDILAIVNISFMHAKRRATGSHQSFAADVQLAIEVAETRGIQGLQWLMPFSLLYATLGSLASNITPTMLRLLSEWGQKERALTIANMMVDSENRAYAFQAIAGGGYRPSSWPGRSRYTRKLDSQILQKALPDAVKIRDSNERMLMFKNLAKEMAEAGDAEGAFHALRAIRDERNEDYPGAYKDTLNEIAERLANAGATKGALDALQIMEAEGSNTIASVAFDIARSFAINGEIKEALRIAVEYDPSTKNYSWADPIDRLAGALMLKTEWFKSLIIDLKSIVDPPDRQAAIATWAEAITKAIAERREADKNEQSEPLPQEVSANVKDSQFLLWLGHYKELLTRVLESEEYFSDYVIDTLFDGLMFHNKMALAEALISQAGRDREIKLRNKLRVWEFIRESRKTQSFDPINNLETLRQYSPDLDIVEITKALCVELLETDRVLEVKDLFKELMKLEEFRDAEYRFPEIVGLLAREGHIDLAERVAHLILTGDELSDAFDPIAGALVGRKRYTDILPTSKRLIKKLSQRLNATANVAAYVAVLDKQQALQVIEDILIDAEYFEDREPVATIYAALARELGKSGEWEDAFRIGREFPQELPPEWSELVAAGMQAANDDQTREKWWTNVLATINEIPNDEQRYWSSRTRVVGCLARSLAQYGQGKFALRLVDLLDDSTSDKRYSLTEIAVSIGPRDPDTGFLLLKQAFELSQPQEVDNADSDEILAEILELRPIFLTNWEEGLATLSAVVDNEVEDKVMHLTLMSAVFKAKAGYFLEARQLVDQLSDSEGLNDVKEIIYLMEFKQILESANESAVVKMAYELIQIYLVHSSYYILDAVVHGLVRQGLLAQMAQLIDKIPDSSDHKLYIQQLFVASLLDKHQLELARTATAAIANVEWREFFNHIISELLQNQRTRLVLSLPLNKVIKLILFIEVANSEPYSPIEFTIIGPLQDLEKLLAEVLISRWDETLTAIESLSWTQRHEAIRAIVTVLIDTGDLPKIQHMFSQLLDELDSRKRYASIAMVVGRLEQVAIDKRLRVLSALMKIGLSKGHDITGKIISASISPVTYDLGTSERAGLLWLIYERLRNLENSWLPLAR